MDELVAHCLREIAFDGDLGCDIPRLRTFVTSFFQQRNQPQTIDSSYFAFLWEVLVVHPSVRVGTVPLEALGTEVWVAPQPKKKNYTPVEVEEEVKLEVVDKTRPLRELDEQYGNGGEGGVLRVAVDTETIFVALTGSHLRPTRLTGTVYTALQLITRGRADGLSVVDLGKKTGYDQKACWYLVRQLVDLGLVVKLRRAGVGANFCIHRHFFERDEQWQGIQAETLASTTSTSTVAFSTPTLALDDEDDDFQPDAEVAPLTNVTFEPIDARHLSSLALVKARIVTLLRSAPGNVYPAQNLVVTIGFTNPTKTERRFFQSRLRELVDQGVIERCTVPHPNPRRSKYRVPSIRLLDADAGPAGEADDAGVDDEEEAGTGRFKATVTLHKQILDLLDAAGGTGMTLNDIVAALGNFDRRTLELILSRADRASPPPHLADLRVAQMLETHGKERRYRYYTLHHYQSIVARENLDDSTGPYANAADVLEGAGGFADVKRDKFYVDEEELRRFVDEFTGEDAKGRAKQRKKGKSTGDGDGEGEGETKKGRKRKRVDTILEEGDVLVEGEGPPVKKRRGRPPKVKDPGAGAGASATPKKRGRPPKTAPAGAVGVAPTTVDDAPLNAEAGPSDLGVDASYAEPGPSTTPGPTATNAKVGPSNTPTDTALPPISAPALATATATSSTAESSTSTSTPKKRGRPRKHPLPEPTLDEHGNPVEPPPKKRGRPRKHPLPGPELDEEGNVVVVPKKRGRPRKSDVVVKGEGGEVREGMGEGGGGEEGGSALRRSGRALKPVVRADAAEDGGEGEDELDQGADSRGVEAGGGVEGAEAENVGENGEAMNLDVQPSSNLEPSAAAFVQALAAFASSAAGASASSTVAPSSGPHAEPMETEPQVQPEPSALPLPEPSNPERPPELTISRPLEPPTGPSNTASAGVPPSETAADAKPTDFGIPIDPALLAETEGAGPSNGQPIAPDVGTPETPKSAKPEDKKPMGRPRGNVSLMRRENEFLKLLTDFNGILNPGSKEFTDAHLELLANLAASNEPTSGLPGVRVDKRTSHTTYDSLEQKGKVKQLKTVVTSSLGHSRQIRVVYLPTAEQVRVQAFLEQIARNGGSNTTASRALRWQEVTAVETAIPEQQKQPALRAPSLIPTRTLLPNVGAAKALPVDLLQVDKGDISANHARSDKLFALDDDTLRDVFLTEKNTLAQKYGWLPGKAARAREVHMAGLEEITKAAPRSRHVVSADQRILSSSFYFNDMRLERWLKIISTLTHNEELTKLMETEKGKCMLMSDVPATIDVDLQIGKARTRARFLDLFEVLCDLKIVTPLKPSTAEDAPVKVQQVGPSSEHPTVFEVWTDNWRASTSRQAAPSYWQFNEHGPMYLWVLSQELPPYWKDVSVQTVDDAAAYWDLLERASIVRSAADGVVLPEAASSTGVQVTSIHLSRTLRRLSSWRAEYELSWHQKHYMRHYVDVKTGNTPVEDVEKGAKTIARIARLTSAPVDVVRDYFEKARKKALRDVERVQARANAAPPAGENIEARRERMASANVQKENMWADLLARVHPDGPLQGSHAARVARVHTRYMHAGAADEGHWESEIQNALHQADVANAAALAPAERSRVVAGGTIAGLPNIPQTGKTVRQLIEAQGTPLETVPKSKKSKKAKRQKEEAAAAAAGDGVTQEKPETTRRRHRFLWSKDFGDLVEDAMVIVRSRCVDMPRIELGALDQVFPAVPRNSVRQRYINLRAEPGKDAYLKRLEEAWVKVWKERRNKTDELPDPDPKSATHFDLVKHVEFLRRHIDKAALKTNQQCDLKLPADISELESLYDVLDHSSAASGWDFLWTSVTEEGREKGLLQNAFCTESDIVPVDDDTSEMIRVAECGLKMVYSTPADRYNIDGANSLLRDLSPGHDAQQIVAVAQKRLQDLGVLSKLVYDPKKPRPGRTMKISEANSNAIGGIISRDTFQDAATIDALYKQPGLDWQEWALEATDGDLAMLVQATSAGTAQFRVDTSNAKQARSKLDWNSKKAVDNDIETSVSVKFVPETLAPGDRPSPSAQSMSLFADSGEHPTPMDTDDSAHGQTTDGELACCRVISDGVIDCNECLRVELEGLLAPLSDEQRTQCENILDVLDEAGSGGLSKAEVAAKLYLPVAEVVPLVEILLDASMPAMLNVGYSSQVLIAARHARPWTVTVSFEPLSRILPRRWLDIGGRRIPDVYESAQRAVMSTVLLRPGISQAEVRWRLNLLYDAQEVLEVLKTLHDAGFLCRRGQDLSLNSLISPSLDEEKQTMWFVTERPWYQV